MKCRAINRAREPIDTATTERFVAAAIQFFRAPLCNEKAIAETVLGPKCARHLEEFRTAMADPNTLGNVIAAKGGEPRGRTPKEIDAMIRFIQ